MTETKIVAMNDAGKRYDYPSVVSVAIADDKIESYIRAADLLNDQHFDVVSLQHEFGIFGPDAGVNVTALLSRLTMPIVTTFHTVLSEATPKQRSVLNYIVEASSKVVVMADKGRELLLASSRVSSEKIEVIPHGVPDVPFADADQAKATLGFAGKAVILTFGLLSPNKGIEVMIDAMTSIVERRADAVYVVLGATHPNLVGTCGESYRESLFARARELGVENHVLFLDQFVDQATLLEFISMCDVYVTPYLNEAQMTSGTLAYSFGLGKAVVSTPYWHARELLGNGAGVLVPFGDVRRLGDEIASLLTNDDRRRDMSGRAYGGSRRMTWDRIGERYLTVFEGARDQCRLKRFTRLARAAPAPLDITESQLGHFQAMCDDVGLVQHAVHSVPDRSHGYCLDDNARALILACALTRDAEPRISDALTSRFAAFVQHAWNPDLGRFRNFMGYDRRWLEEKGSDDSNARALWALGECAKGDVSASRRRWAAALFAKALPIVESFAFPRPWSFALLGLDAYCEAIPNDRAAVGARLKLADQMMSLLRNSRETDWIWWENRLTYDNARLPQALILSGLSTGVHRYVDAGLESLGWLMRKQISPEGFFRPIGTESFKEKGMPPRRFDQQPLEAAATISACLAAFRVDGDVRWRDRAELAFGWFLGVNDLATPLVDIENGTCRDGLQPGGTNENQGAESVLSYLFGLVEIRQIIPARQESGRESQIRTLAKCTR